MVGKSRLDLLALTRPARHSRHTIGCLGAWTIRRFVNARGSRPRLETHDEYFSDEYAKAVVEREREDVEKQKFVDWPRRTLRERSEGM